MKFNIKIYPAALFVFGFAVTANAQDPKKTEEKTVTEEIEVVRPYKPVLAEAVKLRRSPDLDNVQTYKARFSYTVTDRKLEQNADIQKLQAERLADEKRAALLNNYIKGGAGSLSTLLAEAYFATGRDEALQAGAFFRHFGQQGKIDGQDENKQQLSVFGKTIGEAATFSGKLNFQQHGLKFYGADPAISSVNPVDKQSLKFIEAEGEAVNKYTEDENALSYAAKINGYIFSDKFDAKEKLLIMSASLNKRLSNLNFGLGLSTEIGTTQDLSISSSNNLLRLNPYIRLQTRDIKITAGLNFVQEFGAQSTSRLFPFATADLTVVPDYLQVYGEVKGDVNRTTLKDLTDINPFLGNNIGIENSVEKLKVSAGVKGTAGPGFGYKVMIYSNKVGNMPLFVNRFAAGSRFDVIYDRGNTRITGLEASMVVQVSESFTWTGKINLEQYKPATESASFYHPEARGSSDLVYTYNKKFSFTASLYFQGESDAKIYLNAPSSPYINFKPGEALTTVKGFIDLGAGASYKINSQFVAFAKINNLLNQNYSRYLYYPSYGFNVFGGVSYSF